MYIYIYTLQPHTLHPGLPQEKICTSSSNNPRLLCLGSKKADLTDDLSYIGPVSTISLLSLYFWDINDAIAHRQKLIQ